MSEMGKSPILIINDTGIVEYCRWSVIIIWKMIKPTIYYVTISQGYI